MPILIAFPLVSLLMPNTRSRSGGTSSQPFASISASSCPGAQPAWPSASTQRRGPVPRGDRPQDIHGRSERDLVIDHEGQVLMIIRGVQHEASAGIPEPAEMHSRISARPGRPSPRPELGKQALEAQAVDQTVGHQAHGAVRGVGARVRRCGQSAGPASAAWPRSWPLSVLAQDRVGILIN